MALSASTSASTSTTTSHRQPVNQQPNPDSQPQPKEPTKPQRRAPTISHRISLRFLPAPPTERTRTVVLNAGGLTDVYTDFRPFVDSDPDPRLGERECEWAFAGRKVRLGDERTMWTHVVDSRRPSSGGDGEEEEQDIGTSTALPNGDELECGTMRNPASGHVEAYEEVWHAEAVEEGAKVLALELRVKNASASVSGMDADGDERNVRGVFVRIGPWAQGVVEVETAYADGRMVCARRWKLEQDHEGKSERWVLDAAYGPDCPLMPIPRGSDQQLQDGRSDIEIPLPGSSMAWEVVEEYTWTRQDF